MHSWLAVSMAVGPIRIAGAILVLKNWTCALTARAFGAFEMVVLRPCFYPAEAVAVNNLRARRADTSHALRVIVQRILRDTVRFVRVHNPLAT